jgi:hypothetical protein
VYGNAAGARPDGLESVKVDFGSSRVRCFQVSGFWFEELLVFARVW